MTRALTAHARPTIGCRHTALRRNAIAALAGAAIALSATGTVFAADGRGPDGFLLGGPVAVRRDEPPDDSIPSALLILAAAGVVASVLGRTGSPRHR